MRRLLVAWAIVPVLACVAFGVSDWRRSGWEYENHYVRNAVLLYRVNNMGDVFRLTSEGVWEQTTSLPTGRGPVWRTRRFDVYDRHIGIYVGLGAVAGILAIAAFMLPKKARVAVEETEKASGNA